LWRAAIMATAREDVGHHQCHDITGFGDRWAAGAAPERHPARHQTVHPSADDVSDKNFAYWHSRPQQRAQGDFTDEWGGGTRAVPAHRFAELGRRRIFDVVDTKGRKKLSCGYSRCRRRRATPRTASRTMALIPSRATYGAGVVQGGVSVFDFTDSRNPSESPSSTGDRCESPDHGGYWSTTVQRPDLRSRSARGIDSSNWCDRASFAERTCGDPGSDRKLNTQQHEDPWPASSAVALAFVDQLSAEGASRRARRAVKTALDRDVCAAAGQECRAVLEQLDALRSS